MRRVDERALNQNIRRLDLREEGTKEEVEKDGCRFEPLLLYSVVPCRYGYDG